MGAREMSRNYPPPPPGFTVVPPPPEGFTIINEAAPISSASAGPVPAEPKTQTDFERAREFQQTPLYQQTVGVSPIELVKRLKGAARVVGKTGMGAVQYAQHLAGAKVSPTPLVLEPTADPNEEIGAKLGEAVLTAAPAIATSGASLPVQAAVGSTVGGIQAGPAGAVIGGGIPVAGKAMSAFLNRLPSKARAGAKFQQLKDAGGNLPINTADAQKVAADALDITRHGGGAVPPPIREFIKRTNPVTGKFGGQRVQMAADPVPLESGLKFASNSGRLSVDAATKMSPSMKLQVMKFSQAMKDANREAASRIGMGDLYDAAMKEYAKAMSLEAKKEIVKRYAIRAAATLGLGAAGVTGAKVAGLID